MAGGEGKKDPTASLGDSVSQSVTHPSSEYSPGSQNSSLSTAWSCVSSASVMLLAWDSSVPTGGAGVHKNEN